jgi:hypothetical protein
MKIRMTGTFAISLLLLVLGCSRVHVASEKDFYCSRNCAFVVTPEGDDPLHIRQKIENLLMSKGFVTTSEDLESIEVYMQRREQTTIEKKEESPSKSGEGQNSIYKLRFSYEHYFIVPHGYYIFTDFSASLVNYMDGDVITSANFSQSSFGTKSVMSVLEDFVDKLTGLVKFTPPN